MCTGRSSLSQLCSNRNFGHAGLLTCMGNNLEPEDIRQPPARSKDHMERAELLPGPWQSLLVFAVVLRSYKLIHNSGPSTLFSEPYLRLGKKIFGSLRVLVFESNAGSLMAAIWAGGLRLLDRAEASLACRSPETQRSQSRPAGRSVLFLQRGGLFS